MPYRNEHLISFPSVPYGEIRTKRYILTLVVKELKKIADPQEICNFYNEFVKICYNDFFGFIEDEAQPFVVPYNMRAVMTPWRSFCDVQMCGGSAHSGYPTAFAQSYENRMAKLDELLKAGHWGLWHENGHNFQQSKWKWGSQTEVSCNINIFKWYFRKLGYWAEGSRLTAFQGVTQNYVSQDLPDKDFEKRSGDEQICPYIQLPYGLGWGVYKYLGIQNRVSKDFENSDQGKKDFLAKRVSEYAGANMLPFFDAWGIPVSGIARLYIAGFPDWLTTAQGQKMGVFWKNFDYGPVTNPDEFDDYREPDPSTFPEKPTGGNLDRKGWTVTTSVAYTADGATGLPAHILDGDNATYLALAKPGKGNNTANKDMFFIMDMKGQKIFNTIGWQHRTTVSSDNLRVKDVSVYGCNTGNESDFVLLKGGMKLEVANNATGNGVQKLNLGKIFTYQYIKITFNDWKKDAGNTCQVSEINVGME